MVGMAWHVVRSSGGCILVLSNWSARRLFWTGLLADIAALALILSNEWLLAALCILVALPIGIEFWIRMFRAKAP